MRGRKTKTTTTTQPGGIFEFQTKIVWFNAIGFLLMHLAGFYGISLSLWDMTKGRFLTFGWSECNFLKKKR